MDSRVVRVRLSTSAAVRPLVEIGGRTDSVLASSYYIRLRDVCELG